MAYPLMQGPSHESVYIYPRLLNAHSVSHSTLLRHSCAATPQQKWSLFRRGFKMGPILNPRRSKQEIGKFNVGSKPIGYHLYWQQKGP